MKILAVQRHRNGIGGEGFYVIDFDSGRGVNKLELRAVVFTNEDPETGNIVGSDHYAVLSRNNLPADQQDCWRGDTFIDALIKALQQWDEKDRLKRLHASLPNNPKRVGARK